MTAKVLQLVNSSFFGLPVHVHDVKHAAALLGINALKPLVLSAGVFRQLEESRVPAALAQQVLEHSLAVGCLASELAEVEGLSRDQADNALLAGILHDIGKLVLADHFGRDYALVCMAADTHQPAAAWPRNSTNSTPRTPTSAATCSGLWGLPQDLIEAVAFHHDPEAPRNGSSSRRSRPCTWRTPSCMPPRTCQTAEPAPLRKLDMRYLDASAVRAPLVGVAKLGERAAGRCLIATIAASTFPGRLPSRDSSNSD